MALILIELRFNLEKAHIILDEMVLDGCIIDTNKALQSPQQETGNVSSRGWAGMFISTSLSIRVFCDLGLRRLWVSCGGQQEAPLEDTSWSCV